MRVLLAIITGKVRRLCRALCAGLAILAFCAAPAVAQGVSIPGFWDPGEQLQKPDISSLPRLRFLTTTDFPPFNFIDRRKRLTGFNVDLARAICAELAILTKCQIQALPFAELAGALDRGDGDAIIAGLAPTADMRARFNFSRTYLRIPARFAARKSDLSPATDYPGARLSGVVAGSSHSRWLKAAFPAAKIEEFPDRTALLEALRTAKIDLAFADALSLTYWLNSQASAGCCGLAEGAWPLPDDEAGTLAIAFPRASTQLVAAVDYALKQVNDKGVFAELYLRYFPTGLY